MLPYYPSELQQSHAACCLSNEWFILIRWRRHKWISAFIYIYSSHFVISTHSSMIKLLLYQQWRVYTVHNKVLIFCTLAQTGIRIVRWNAIRNENSISKIETIALRMYRMKSKSIIKEQCTRFKDGVPVSFSTSMSIVQMLTRHPFSIPNHQQSHSTIPFRPVPSSHTIYITARLSTRICFGVFAIHRQRTALLTAPNQTLYHITWSTWKHSTAVLVILIPILFDYSLGYFFFFVLFFFNDIKSGWSASGCGLHVQSGRVEWAI